MAESLYGMLSKLLLDDEIVRNATKKTRDKVKKSYDTTVRKEMVQYYLDQYEPSIYKRQANSPLFLAYKTRSKLVNDGKTIDLWVEHSGIDISNYYNSSSYYHQTGSTWTSVSAIHSMSAAEYKFEAPDLRDEYGYDNGTVQGSWILENFELGIHPRTNGWPRKKRTRRMRYVPKRDKRNPLQMADIYAGDFAAMDMTYQYIYSEMFNEWKKRL